MTTTIVKAVSRVATFAAVGAALCVASAPASADSFYFGFTNASPHWRPYHHPPRHSHRGYVWGPPVVFYAPSRVVYRTAPVVFAPPPGAPVTVTPAGEPYRTADGRYCREYTATVTVGGYPQPSYGTACRMPDGTWHIVN